jgi:hypothetical protein
LETLFRTGAIFVDLAMSVFQGELPAYEELVPLIELLLGRIADVAAATTPTLSQRAMHSARSGPRRHQSVRRPPRDRRGIVRQSADTDASFQARSASLTAAKLEDFYLVWHALDPGGLGDLAQAVNYVARVFAFASEADAEA